ncbi:putative disease resistance protein RGA3 [Macadamia integrifolia]|uniref:putative disease resistance protein RGA3 n=1 Tax=Macadamia integrifolia TaxID=60698 RepID=UPI001C4E5333|nr:putative disease resistance protein RGA3 [Macadamia integrifolia]
MALVEGAVLSASFQVLFEKLASPIFKEIGSRWGVSKDLKKLMRKLLLINDVLNDAEERKISNSAVKLWLNDLQQLAYDAEDIVDEYETENQLSKLAAGAQTNTNQVLNLLSSSFNSSVSALNYSQEMTFKMKDITERLEDLVEQMDVLELRKRIEGKGKENNLIVNRPATSSLVDESHIHGRESDKNKIIELLVTNEPLKNKVGILPIVGMGGMGKTALAQLIYNDERVVNHFELRAWVWVSEEFVLERLTKSILESITQISSDLKDLDPLQCKLKETLRGKRFLLVLDDIWNENADYWDVLKIPFMAGKEGSKILVTTRSKLVSSLMRTDADFELDGLEDEDCWSLFSRRAFAGRDDPLAHHQNLQAIGKEIVKKCRGLPLAAKALGGLLHSKVDKHYWSYMLRSEIWDLPEEKSNIMPALRLSYTHLPANVKRCFAYCSIFPKGYRFEKEELVLLWMAEGFLPSRGGIRAEDRGYQYFDDLVSRSLFQHSGNDRSSEYVLHDLIHDLAVSISGEISFRHGGSGRGNSTIDQSCLQISKSTRHSSLFTKYNEELNFEDLYEAKNLRTFLLRSEFGNGLEYRIHVPHISSKWRFLRVLCLPGIHNLVLPDSIGMLIHLRYLDFQHTCIENFPASIGKLYNLQTLILGACRICSRLGAPKDIANLVNLRHIRVIIESNYIDIPDGMPHGIGRLTSLQTLTHFGVGKNKGARLGDLKNLVHIQGGLSILQLENVDGLNETIEANLKDKQKLDRLWLCWGDGERRNDEEETIEHLEPPMGIEELNIEYYFGERMPRWIVILPNLVKLELICCETIRVLPPLGQLPSLKHLKFFGMHGIRHIGSEFYGDGNVKGFPLLETLEFDGMTQLEEWSGVNGLVAFPHLQKLEVTGCFKWRGFSSSIKFPALELLNITDCEGITSLEMPRNPSLNDDDSGGDSEDMFPCLLKLGIVECPNLQEIMPDIQHKLSCLVSLKISGGLARTPGLFSYPAGGLPITIRSLDISGWNSLENFHPMGGLLRLTSVEELTIGINEGLMSFPDEVDWMLPIALKHLTLSCCWDLVTLQTQGLPITLTHLEIFHCDKLQHLPEEDLPHSITHLEITFCPLLEESCKRNQGRDWSKISHIPNITINRTRIS